MALASSIAAWVLLAAGLALVAWSLFSDRPRGRRRCKRCWYDMSATDGFICPECGRRARAERELRRTRRRWRWTVASLALFAAAYSAYATPRISRSGWIGLVPTTGLIWWVGAHEPPEVYANGKMSTPTRWAGELAVRASAEELWRWQRDWLMERLGAVRGHTRWPRDRPYAVSTGVPHWLQAGGARPVFGATRPRSAQSRIGDHLFAWEIGVLAPDDPVAEVAIACGRYRTIWRRTITLVDRAEDAITPVTSPEIDAAVLGALGASLSPDSNAATGHDSLLGARLYRSTAPELDDMAVGVVVEFLHGGAPVASYPLCPTDSPFGDPVDWVRINTPGPDWQHQSPADLLGWPSASAATPPPPCAI